MTKSLCLILQLHGFRELFQMKKCGSTLHTLCGTTLQVVSYPMTKQLPSTSPSLLPASGYHWTTCRSLIIFLISGRLLSIILLHRHLRLPPACPISHLLMSGASSESSYTLIFSRLLACPARWFKHILPVIYFPMEIATLYCLTRLHLKSVSILVALSFFDELNPVL